MDNMQSLAGFCYKNLDVLQTRAVRMCVVPSSLVSCPCDYKRHGVSARISNFLKQPWSCLARLKAPTISCLVMEKLRNNYASLEELKHFQTEVS
jgi:hypothetical protein